jgi:hypothetical protein
MKHPGGKDLSQQRNQDVSFGAVENSEHVAYRHKYFGAPVAMPKSSARGQRDEPTTSIPGVLSACRQPGAVKFRELARDARRMLADDVGEIPLAERPVASNHGHHRPTEDRLSLGSKDSRHVAPHFSTSLGDEIGEFLELGQRTNNCGRRRRHGTRGCTPGFVEVAIEFPGEHYSAPCGFRIFRLRHRWGGRSASAQWILKLPHRSLALAADPLNPSPGEESGELAHA